jgi:hypothetical protein
LKNEGRAVRDDTTTWICDDRAASEGIPSGDDRAASEGIPSGDERADRGLACGKAREEDLSPETRVLVCIRVKRSKGTMACRGKYK